MKQTLSLFLFLFIGWGWMYNGYSQDSIRDSLFYYDNLVRNPKRTTDFVNVYRFYEKHKKMMLEEEDTLSAIFDLRLMSNLQKKFGFLSDSEMIAVEALTLLDFLEPNEATIECRVGLYNQLGIIKRENNDYDEALKYYDKALEIALIAFDSIRLLNNKGNVYLYQKKYILAIEMLEEAYKKQVEIGDEKRIAKALTQLGVAQSCDNRPEGLTNMLEALRIREDIEDIIGLYASYKNLVKYYKKRNDYLKAKYYADKAYNVAKSINSPYYVRDALSYIVDLDGNPLVAEYKRLSDSLNRVKELRENKFATLKYEKSEYVRQAQESELERAKERDLKVRYQFVGILLVISSVGLYLLLRVHHNKEKVRQIYNTETRISKKIHDEVANDLFQVMTKLQSPINSREQVLDSLESIYNKTRDISKENNIIDVRGDFDALLNDLLLSYQSDSVNVITRHIKKIDWDAIEGIKKITIFRVLQELMVNMRKHSEASIVALTFSQFNTKISINYSDNGVGAEIKKNSGIPNMENRINSINGNIIFESEPGKGFKVKIII